MVVILSSNDGWYQYQLDTANMSRELYIVYTDCNQEYKTIPILILIVKENVDMPLGSYQNVTLRCAWCNMNRCMQITESFPYEAVCATEHGRQGWCELTFVRATSGLVTRIKNTFYMARSCDVIQTNKQIDLTEEKLNFISIAVSNMKMERDSGYKYRIFSLSVACRLAVVSGPVMGVRWQRRAECAVRREHTHEQQLHELCQTEGGDDQVEASDEGVEQLGARREGHRRHHLDLKEQKRDCCLVKKQEKKPGPGQRSEYLWSRAEVVKLSLLTICQIWSAGERIPKLSKAENDVVIIVCMVRTETDGRRLLAQLGCKATVCLTSITKKCGVEDTLVTGAHRRHVKLNVSRTLSRIQPCSMNWRGRGRLRRHRRRSQTEREPMNYSLLDTQTMTSILPGHYWSEMNSAGPALVLELRDTGAPSPLQDRARVPGARRAWAGR